MSENAATNRRITPEMLLLEYLLLTREQMTYQTTVMQSFSTTIQNSTNTIRSLLQRYIEIQDRARDRREERETNNINQQSRVNFRIPSTDGTSRTDRENRRTDYWYSASPSWNFGSSRNYRQSPLSSTTLRRRRVRTQNRTRPRRERRDILTQILENTLYSSPNRQPASQIDISRNVSTHIWTDISDTTDQTICPITQENFQSNDNIARIDYCGHLFHDEALRTYLNEFDHRCPICRYNIRTTYPTDPYAHTNTATSTDISAVATEASAADSPATDTSTPSTDYNIQSFRDLSNNPPRALIRTDSNVLDISFNFSNLGFSNSTSLPNITTEPFEFNFTPANFDTAINQLSNAMLSSLTNAINNPDNSGNTIAAEYSVFIPQPVTRDESTSTEDDDTETY